MYASRIALTSSASSLGYSPLSAIRRISDSFWKETSRLSLSHWHRIVGMLADRPELHESLLLQRREEDQPALQRSICVFW